MATHVHACPGDRAHIFGVFGTDQNDSGIQGVHDARWMVGLHCMAKKFKQNAPFLRVQK
jgi:hypothetical protein